MNTDEQHRFFDIGLNQPVCSIRTIYYIEQGYHNNDDDVLIFLIHKFGYEYYQDEILDKLLEQIIDQCLFAIKNLNFKLLHSLENKIENLNIHNKFLYHAQYELLKGVFDLYLQDDFKNCQKYLKKEYPLEALYGNGVKLEQILKMNCCGFLERNFFQVNQYIDCDDLNILDLKLLYIVQIVNNSLYRHVLKRYIVSLEEHQEAKKHFMFKVSMIHKSRENIEMQLKQKDIIAMIEKQDKYGCILLLEKLISNTNYKSKKYCKMLLESLTK